MCGISGIAGVNWESAQLHRMVSSLKHRGPDDEGFFIDEKNDFAIGHRRLSILDLSLNPNKCPGLAKKVFLNFKANIFCSISAFIFK